MRISLVVLCLILFSLPAFAQDAQVNTGKPATVTVAKPHFEAPAAQALTDAERCSVDSLVQRATIVALRAELAKLTVRVAELEAPLVSQAVQKERGELEQRFRERLKPADGSVFDWQTLTFTAPHQAPPQAPAPAATPASPEKPTKPPA